jgi:signal transduction histidine kinase
VNAEGSVAQLVATVSHDLKAPLGTIRLAAAYLADELIPDVEERRLERKNLEIIQRSVQRMTRLIDDLLSANAAAAGQFRVVRSRQSAETLIDDALETLRPIAEAKGVELTEECSASSPVFADRDRMLQVFTNIGGNAIKFTPAGGRVTIRAADVRGAVRFDILDTGPGIAPDDLPRVFDRFWQGKHGAALGHGLGLAIAKGIIHAHGGHIGVSSTLGSGSMFYFTVPNGVRRAMRATVRVRQ